MKKFKYTSTITASGVMLSGTNLLKEEVYASAPLEGLRGILPDKEKIEANDDLLYFACNIGVANMINKNDDGVFGADSIQSISRWVDKPMNIEHDRGYVVGHVTNSGFSSFGDNEIVGSDSVSGADPFNMVLGGVVYKTIAPYFSEYMEEENGEMSASWEIGFDEFHIAAGSKLLSNARIISDPEEIKKVSPLLKSSGGPGNLDDGTPIYRVPINWHPLGGGFTFNPAGAVKGVLTAALEGEVGEKLKDDAKATMAIFHLGDTTPGEAVSNTTADDGEKVIPDPKESNAEEFDDNSEQEKNKEKISQSKEKAVIRRDMKINSIDDIQQDTLGEMTASAIRDFIHDGLKQVSDQYETEKAELASAEEEAKKKAEATEQELADTQSKIDSLEKEIASIKAASEKIEAQAALDARVAELTEELSLSEEEQSEVAKQIASMDDEAYAAWKGFSVKLIANRKGEEKEEEPKEIIASVKSKEDSPVPNSVETKEDKYAAAKASFKIGEGVTIV